MTIALVGASYLACASLATYPVVLTFGSAIPGQLTDPLEHLWIMRWSEACLLDGRSPFFCPSLNYPTGLPLGCFPTMHVQTLAYLALGLATDNDVARFNVLWFFGFVSTGLSTFALAWWTVRRSWPAWLSGLGAMLSGPMLMHAHGHLETMQMGAVPLFLIAWLRLVDRPAPARLFVSVGFYMLVVAFAPYFAVLSVFPAACYVAWSVIVERPASRQRWLIGRAAWMLGFGALALPGLALLFSSQLWAAQRGYAMARPRSQFNQFGAPPWSSFVPSPLHALGRFLTPDLFEVTGYSSRMSECSSYLGVVTLALLSYAAIRRLRFPRRGFWWSVLLLMVVLSWGSQIQIGSTRISLPAGWIYGVFPPFHLIRVPARFNLFAAICAAVPASAALADLMGRIKRPAGRAALTITFAVLTLADLSMVPFETSAIPPMPGIYRELTYRNPEATLLEIPQFGSNEGQVFSSLWGYWQSIHHGRTSAGYPGLPNVAYEAEIVRPSPFRAGRLLDPAYLANPGPEDFGPVRGVDARDYAWLFLAVHRFDHVVLHQGTWTDPKFDPGNARIKALLGEAKSFEDGDVAVFDRERLRPPEDLTWLCAEGFRPALSKHEPWSFGVLKKARVALFNPTPDRPIVLRLVNPSAFSRTRLVRVMHQDRVIVRWTVGPAASPAVETPPFRLEGGVQELQLESDGDDRPARYADRLDESRTRYCLRVDEVRVRFADGRDR